jgi:hypothetical protein
LYISHKTEYNLTVARTRRTPAERAHYTNVSDVYLAFCCLFFFGGTFLLVGGVAWDWVAAIWLIALYLFGASVYMWMRRD